jgi:hypothetical protein
LSVGTFAEEAVITRDFTGLKATADFVTRENPDGSDPFMLLRR